MTATILPFRKPLSTDLPSDVGAVQQEMRWVRMTDEEREAARRECEVSPTFNKWRNSLLPPPKAS